MKQAAARAALEHAVEGRIVGVGTGSTARLFIEELGGMKDRIAAVASSRTPASDWKSTASVYSI